MSNPDKLYNPDIDALSTYRTAYQELIDRYKTNYIPRIIEGDLKVFTSSEHVAYYTSVLYPKFVSTEIVSAVTDKNSNYENKCFNQIDFFGLYFNMLQTFFELLKQQKVNYVTVFNKYDYLCRLLKLEFKFLSKSKRKEGRVFLERKAYYESLSLENIETICLAVIQSFGKNNQLNTDIMILQYICEFERVQTTFKHLFLDYFCEKVNSSSNFLETWNQVYQESETCLAGFINLEFANSVLNGLRTFVPPVLETRLKENVKRVVEELNQPLWNILINVCLQNKELHQEYAELVGEVIRNKYVTEQTGAEYVEFICDFVTQTHFIHRTNVTFAKQVFAHAKLLCNKDLATLCDFIDDTMKSTNQEIQAIRVNAIGKIFVFIEDKDVFYEFYVTKLASRLLNKRYTSLDVERELVGHFKLQAGASYTKNAELMLNDHVKHVYDICPEFNCTVLNTACWPSFYQSNPILPPSLSNHLDEFQAEYYRKNPSTKLMMVYSVGSCLLTAIFNRVKYEFNLVPLQAIVLLVFNDRTLPLSFEEIKTLTGIETECLKKILHSLSCNKVIILNKHPPSKKIDEKTDTFTKNLQFSSKVLKIKVPLPSLESPKTPQQIEVDRNNIVDAIIVRLMKSRKQLQHQALVSETLQTTRDKFPVQPPFIKKRIESLIERDYLERDDNRPDLYTYVA